METILCDPVREDLERVEQILCSRVDGASRLETALRGLIASGGKRLRPRLALLTGTMLGAEKPRLLALAAAIELLHTATLIHDDLVDGASLRRGRPTLNTRYPAGTVVLAGDFVFAHAVRLVSGTGSPALMRLFAQTLTTMAGGELAHACGGESATKWYAVSREGYYRWIHAKTASLFELACGAAALLAPAGRETVAAARRFGRHLGMAFQITDDVLDFSGDPARTGKPVGGDLRQGAITLPALYHLESHPDLDPAALRVDGAALEQLVATIRRNGSIPRARREAEGFVERALGILHGFPATPEREALADLAHSVVHRES